MTQFLKIKSTICNYIIIREWIENGEFNNADKVIIVGTRFQAIIVKSLFRRSTKKVLYCTKLEREYKYNSKTKWIVFDRNIKRVLPENDYNILIMPRFRY